METLAVETWRIQLLSFIASFIFIFFIFRLILKRRLREEYSLLWLASAFAVIGLSLWRGSLELMARMMGVAYAPAALFIVILGAFMLILLHLTIVISSHRDTIRTLVQ